MVSLFAGFFAGFLHVIAGPDHLAAVIPLVVRQPLTAFYVGLRWGIGHALGVILLALLGLTLREQLDLDQISASAEQVVGVALILLGCWVLSRRGQLVIHSHTHEHRHDGLPIKEKEISAHHHLHIHQGSIDHDAPSAHRAHSHAPSWMGLLHGL
ncbi:MAG: hydantoin utilization protein A, partial [Myxococcota bacterium]|nr:hydantoin utilization protein A [Myxococcota bacterium]